MTDQHTPTPDSAGWIEWKGGDCPVAGSDVVLVRDRHGLIHGPHAADGWIWTHDGGPRDIFAYCADPFSDRLADERSALAEPPSSDPSAIAGAIERITKVLDGPFNLGANGYADADIRTLLADRARLTAALTEIARLRTELRGNFSMGSRQSDIARKALGTEGRDDG